MLAQCTPIIRAAVRAQEAARAATARAELVAATSAIPGVVAAFCARVTAGLNALARSNL